MTKQHEMKQTKSQCSNQQEYGFPLNRYSTELSAVSTELHLVESRILVD